MNATLAIGEAALCNDPRRPGRAMALIRCWCGRAYTLTPEAAHRHAVAGTPPCPDLCGKGTE